MRQTLFHIPHVLYGLPVFGLWSWGTVLIALFATIQLAFARTSELRREVFQSNLVVWISMLAVNAFLLPRIETKIDDWPVGLPIRGYGVMLMLGVLSGAAVAMRRSERRGMTREAFFSLATWTVVSGIVGARLFYVVQHWSQLDGASIREKLFSAFQFTEGGLVVYGGVMGGLVALFVWAYRFQYSLFSVADAVTPAFFLGLAFGRLGCLLNGCCYGGVCDTELPSIAFPAGSEVYSEQLANGRLLGIETQDKKITSIDAGSWGDRNGLQPGQKLDWVQWEVIGGPTREEPLKRPQYEGIAKVDGKITRIEADQVPARSVGVHPSQIYASIGGLVLFLWTASFSPFLKRPGQVFGVGLIAYGFVRILEEYIRVDEVGQFGTDLSISQWISLIGIVAGLGLLLYSMSKPLPAESAALAT